MSAHPIVRYCRDSGRSQKWLAERLGVSSAYVSYIVNGRKAPSVNAMVGILNVTNGKVTPNALVAWWIAHGRNRPSVRPGRKRGSTRCPRERRGGGAEGDADAEARACGRGERSETA